MNLTQKQETFALNLFKGMYQRDAYIDAYKATYSMETVDANASRLAHNVKVLARLQELQEAIVDTTVMTVQERKERLSKIGNEELLSSKGSIIRSGNIQAIDLLNKMERIYEEGIKVNIDNRTIEIIVSSDTAKKLTEQIIKGEGTEQGL